MSVAENLKRIRSEIEETSIKAGRNPSDVDIIAVTKTRSVSEISEAYDAGLKHFGENRVREAGLKIPIMADDIEWHMIGHLQSNKVKEAVRLFSWIDSVDSVEKAELISTRGVKEGKTIKVLVQVKVAGEDTKSGADPRDIDKIVRYCYGKESIELCGLMTIGSLGVPEEETRKEFRLVKSIFDSLREKKEMSKHINVLSMGMSDDFRIAIEEGSTILRLGTAIFGRRN